MKEPIRFFVRVGSDGPGQPDRQITLSTADETPIGAARPLEAAGLAGPHVETLPPEDRFLWLLCKPDEATEARRLHRLILDQQRPQPDEMVAYGELLFDKLIGAAAWQELVNRAAGERIELALQFDPAVQALHRFPWEMMRGPDGFLAKEAAVTRLVLRPAPAGGDATAVKDAPRLRVPPRVLFVVGKSLTDQALRPGAEYFGLLRQLRAGGLTIHSRVVQQAKPAAIRSAIQCFEPDVVHFICHGGLDPQRGSFLRLSSDEAGQEAQWFAPQIWDALQAAKRPAPVVVLSACYSAAAPAAALVEPPLDDRQMGSLAAELVAQGVPIVVGMSGSVADQACRLFTRRFGEALVGGEPLVGATAQGRWAAFLRGRPETVDWVFPVIFMDASIPAGYRPVERLEGKDPGELIKKRVDSFVSIQHPVFGGRAEFFEAYEHLLGLSAHPVLLIRTESNQPGLGRTRLLRELAAQAVRDGHVPVLVTSAIDDWRPLYSNVAQLGLEILRAVWQTRQVFGLEPPVAGNLLAPLFASDLPGRQTIEATYPNLRMRMGALLAAADKLAAGAGAVTAEVVKIALQEDFRQLILDARTAEQARAVQEARTPLVGPGSRVILLLDQTQFYGQALDPLLRELLDENGLGPPEEPAPVILCYARGSANDAGTDDKVEKMALRWLRRELGPFRPDGEDMLAYERIMLNPDPEKDGARVLAEFVKLQEALAENLPVAPMAINDRAGEDKLRSLELMLRQWIKGVPQRLEEDAWYIVLQTAYETQKLVHADDEIRLRKL